MSVWRRRAIESFPELRRELNDRQEIWNPYSLWFELLSMWRDAHRSGNDEMLVRIYRYAEWCSRQRADDLWNSVGVCFYEHVLDHGGWETVLPWLSDETIWNVWGLWEFRLSETDMASLRKLMHEQGRSVPPPAPAWSSQRNSRRSNPPPRDARITGALGIAAQDHDASVPERHPGVLAALGDADLER